MSANSNNGCKFPSPTARSSTPSKRKMENQAATSNSETPSRPGTSSSQPSTPRRIQQSPSQRNLPFSPNQPAQLTLPQVKRLHSTPYSNAMTFVARAVKVEPARKMFDSRVQLHRQKIVFADHFTLLVCYMHTDLTEDPNDPKVLEGYTHTVTNFRVVKKGEILLHDQTETEL